MTPTPVVSNASPVIALEQIDHLQLLQHLFGTVLIPPAVAYEVAPTVTLPAWIEQQELEQPVGPRILGASLGSGESEAIALALETQAQLVILDERPARRLAQALYLPTIGTLGILLAAKQRQLLVSIRPHLDTLLQYDFRIASSLYDEVLRAADEDPGAEAPHRRAR